MPDPSRRGLTRRLIPMLALSALTGCAGGEKDPNGSSERRVVIVVSVDSLRTSRVGAYGYARPTTPHLDRFAGHAYRFERAYSTSSWTKPAMASLFSAHPVHDHLAVFSLGRADQLASFMAGLDWSLEAKQAVMGRGMVVPTHIEPFHARLTGFKKAAFLNNPHLAPEFGFDRSWDSYTLYPPKRPRKGRARARQIHRDALAFLDAHGHDDLYVWIHHNDVHHPYGPVEDQAEHFRGDFTEEEFRSYGRAAQFRLAEKAKTDPRARLLLSTLYDAGLRTFDGELGAFFDALRERGLFDPALILVTADHGEEFFEHGVFGHGHNLFDVTSTVPFLLKLPGQAEGQVVGEPVSLIDVGPTVLDHAGVADLGELPGQSLLPVVQDGLALERPILSELMEGEYEISLVRSGHKLRMIFEASVLLAHLKGEGTGEIEPRLLEVYDLEADPDETRPLPLEGNEALHRRMYEQMAASLDGELNLLSRLDGERGLGGEVDYPSLIKNRDNERFREIEEQLEALGYL